MQESLVRVGVRWSTLRDGNPGGYARTTLVRLNIDRIRLRRRELLGRHHPDVPVEVDSGLDPSLVAALQVLPSQQRAAVVLRFVADTRRLPATSAARWAPPDPTCPEGWPGCASSWR